MYIYVNNIKNYFLNSMIFDYVCIVIWSPEEARKGEMR